MSAADDDVVSVRRSDVMSDPASLRPALATLHRWAFEAAAAKAEMVAIGDPCPTCNGRGHDNGQHIWRVVCFRCDGKKVITDASEARYRASLRRCMEAS